MENAGTWDDTVSVDMVWKVCSIQKRPMKKNKEIDKKCVLMAELESSIVSHQNM
jgi:hypothetical protein